MGRFRFCLEKEMRVLLERAGSWQRVHNNVWRCKYFKWRGWAGAMHAWSWRGIPRAHMALAAQRGDSC